MAANTQLSVNDAVGEALIFTRENLRLIVTVALIGAAVSTLLSIISLSAGPLQPIVFVASFATQAAVYAAFLNRTLRGAGSGNQRLVADTGRLMAAMAIIGLFLFLVLLVGMFPGVMLLAMGPLAPYANELQAAGEDQAAAMAIMTRFMQENPLPILIFVIVYLGIWLLLTSRLYLAAPATVDRNRILSFDTWRWTKGNALRIAFARLMLLGPAYVLVMTLAFIVGQALGVDVLAPAASAANAPALLIYLALLSFLNFGLYFGLEAGLTAAIYKRLAPPAA